MNRPLVARVLASAVLSGFAASAFAAASGNVKISGDAWKVVDGMAYKTDEGLRVTLGGGMFDRKEMAKDGKIDMFDFMGAGYSTLTLKIEADGSMNCVDFSSKRGGGSSCGSLGGGLKLTKNTATEIAGTLKGSSGDDTVDVQFALPVESAKVARAGTALPAGGGEPGKALMATIAAVQSGDLKKIKAVSPADRLSKIEASEKSGEAKDMVEMMKMMTPVVTKITGGTVDGDTATLDWTGTEDGQPAKGTADMTKVGGTWYMAGLTTRN